MRKKQTIDGVVFDASSRTLDFSGAVSGFDVRRLYAIINGATMIYAIASPGLGAASVAGNVVTLEYDTTAMADDDPLTVLYEIDDTGATASKQDTLLAAVQAPQKAGGVADSAGTIIYPDSMAVTSVTRDAAGNLLTQTRSDGTNSWVQTITRDSAGNIATISKWVRQ